MTLLLAVLSARADVPALPEDCSTLEEGDTCTTDAGDAGTCKNGACVKNEESKRCATASGAAGGMVVLALGLLALRRRD